MGYSLRILLFLIFLNKIHGPNVSTDVLLLQCDQVLCDVQYIGIRQGNEVNDTGHVYLTLSGAFG